MHVMRGSSGVILISSEFADEIGLSSRVCLTIIRKFRNLKRPNAVGELEFEFAENPSK